MLGRSEFKLLLKWRMGLRKELKAVLGELRQPAFDAHALGSEQRGYCCGSCGPLCGQQQSTAGRLSAAAAAPAAPLPPAGSEDGKGKGEGKGKGGEGKGVEGQQEGEAADPEEKLLAEMAAVKDGMEKRWGAGGAAGGWCWGCWFWGAG